MYKKIIFIITLSLSSTTLIAQNAMDYLNMAMEAEKEYKYDEAIRHYESLGIILKGQGKTRAYAGVLHQTAYLNNNQGRYRNAIELYETALAIYEELEDKTTAALLLNNIGSSHDSLGKYKKALIYYKKALAIYEESGDKSSIATNLSNIGLIYSKWGKYELALTYYTQALEINKGLESKDDIAWDLNKIGHAYFSWCKYDKAIDFFNQAMKINQETNNYINISDNLNGIGIVCYNRGQYKKAIEYFERSLVIDKKQNHQIRIAGDLDNIGLVYFQWGQFEKAIEYYNKSLSINKNSERKSNTALTLNNIGLANHSLENYKIALEYFNKALIINKELGLKEDEAMNLNNIGMTYWSEKMYDKALIFYKNAMLINEELEIKSEIATGLTNTGILYYEWEKYEKALDYFNRALLISEELQLNEHLHRIFNNIGQVYFELKAYPEAASYFQKSINIKEALRLTASGPVRRDYLASQIETYQLLSSVHILAGNPEAALDTIELSRAKYLVEQLSEKTEDTEFVFSGISNWKKKLADNTAIISYANTSTDKCIQIAADNNSVRGFQINNEKYLKDVFTDYESSISSNYEKMRGLRIYKNGKKTGTDDSLKKIINYYRILLSKPVLSAEDSSALTAVSKKLYMFLFEFLEESIKGKETLIIIPDGILGFLPFETLIMPDGKYLIEKYHIKYSQSLTVSELISKRNYQKKRSPLIAFGGAVYERAGRKKEIISTEKELVNLVSETRVSMEMGGNLEDAYSSLGISNWKNIPGTLKEVELIKEVIKNSTVYKGNSVNETKIKELSDTGVLASHRIIHFATHGIVMPEIPELSAIVLSQFKDNNKGEDGYLNMKEIASLDIQADFVNLSACETGLGKIYSGEGIVGLTQSFLVAGANSLSASLWQVADESTMKFMIGVYKLAEEKKLTYDKAITEMKRRFIGDSKYSNPFFWAPFVYYGN